MPNNPDHATAFYVSPTDPGLRVYAAVGLLKWLFGADYADVGASATPTTVERAGHQRQRVIGGPTSTVGATTYTLSPSGGGGKGINMVGKKLRLITDDNEEFSVRFSGTQARAAQMIYQGAENGESVRLIYSEKGRKIKRLAT
jgi:hypothetical protein